MAVLDSADPRARHPEKVLPRSTNLSSSSFDIFFSSAPYWKGYLKLALGFCMVLSAVLAWGS